MDYQYRGIDLSGDFNIYKEVREVGMKGASVSAYITLCLCS